ncbi:PIG-L family deacetylase [Georgenia yuyongxinii]
MTSTQGTRTAELPTGGVLGVFAHPDDETLGAGGLLASAARVGLPVTVVTGNRGERGQVIPRELAHLHGDAPALVHERERELARACAELGVRAHLFLDQLPGLSARRPPRITDSGMVWVRPGLAGPVPDAGPDAQSTVPVEVAGRLLAGLVRRTRPQVVITEEPHGGYGHPDHVHAHQVTMRGVEMAADAGEVDDADDPLTGLEPWHVPLVVWAVESEIRMRAALHWLEEKLARAPQFGVRGDALATLPAGSDLPSLAFPASKVDLTIDTTAVLSAVVAAMRAYRTQLQNVHLEDLSRTAQRDQPACGWVAVSNGLLLPIMGSASMHVATGFDRMDELVVEPVHHAYTEQVPVAERYGLAGTFGLAALDVKNRLADTRGPARLAAFLGGTVLA